MVKHRLCGVICLILLAVTIVWSGPLTSRRMPDGRFKDWIALQLNCSDTEITQIWRQPLTDLPKDSDGYIMVSYQVRQADSARQAVQNAQALLQKARFSDYTSKGYTVTQTSWSVAGQHGAQFVVAGMNNSRRGEPMSAERAEIFTFATAQDNWVVWLEVRQKCTTSDLYASQNSLQKAGGRDLAEELVNTVLQIWLSRSTTDTPSTVPDKPVAPVTPATPTTPATPDKPAPTTPATPAIPEKPTTPAVPDKPATPDKPAVPGTPATPTTPDKPAAQPEKPAPVSPSDQPVAPTVPEKPATPAPATPPDKPATLPPDKPATPTTPAPATPDKPTAPAPPATPDKPATPATPEKPVTPAVPATTEKPTTPAQPVTPTAPDKPTVPATPTAPEKPATPATPATPSTPDKPAAPVTPAAPDKPATPTPPDKPATPPAPRWETADKGLSLVMPNGWSVHGTSPYLFSSPTDILVRVYPVESYKDDKELKEVLQEFIAGQKEISAAHFSQQNVTIDGATGVMVNFTNYAKRTTQAYYLGKNRHLWRIEVDLPGENTVVPEEVSRLINGMQMN